MKITQEEKERILKLDPDFFKVKLEVGKWYKIIDKNGQFTKSDFALIFFDGKKKTFWIRLL